MVLIVFGLPGTGKTYFAKALADTLNATYINSDTIRDSFSKPNHYTQEEKIIVYDLMLKKTLTAIHEGKTVVVDATFYKDELRRRFTSYIREPGMLHFIETTADDAVVRERLSNRHESHADYGVYKMIKADWDPVQFPHLTVQSTNDNIKEMIAKVLDYLKLDVSNKELYEDR